MKQTLCKTGGVNFLGQKLSSWPVQQQQLRYDVGGKEGKSK